MTRKKPKCERLSLRCTVPQKHMMDRVAEKRGLSRSRCTIALYEEENKRQKIEENIAAAVCDMQTLINHIKNHHMEDDFLMEECDKIWEELNL